jgi:hypothetical protein
MKTGPAVLVGVVVGALGILAVQRLAGGGRPSPPPPPPPSTLPAPSPLPSPTCDALVKLSVKANRIVVEPDIVCLAVGRSLSWDIVDAGDVEIDFKEQNAVKGPFIFDNANNPSNTAPGKYNHTSPGRVASNRADKRGRWRYTVRWKTTTGEQLPDLDPAVCVRD